MSIVTVVMMAVFSMKNPFDDMHQKRLFVLHLENVRVFAHVYKLCSHVFYR